MNGKNLILIKKLLKINDGKKIILHVLNYLEAFKDRTIRRRDKLLCTPII